jgi:uncharacterized SAM-binding protein YcdF (DUF218 family)
VSELDHDPFLRRDIGHSLTVALLAVLLSAGLLYLVYLRRVWRVAAASGSRAEGDGPVLVFGKRLVDGGPDADYRRRLERALDLVRQPPRPLLLLGGGPPGVTEAEVGLAALREAGLPSAVPVQLEDRSLDTLQNLRNARRLLDSGRRGPLLLVSNRYHLARCASLAAALGLDYRLCAAETEFDLREQRLGRLAQEAAYLCWLEVGRGWARLIGHHRMVERVS